MCLNISSAGLCHTTFHGTANKEDVTLTDLFLGSVSEHWQSNVFMPSKVCWPHPCAVQSVYVLVEVPYPLLHRDFVVVSDGVLPEEVELNHVFLPIQFRMQLDVLYSQRAAAHGVSCLSFFFFITSSQGKLHSYQDKRGKEFKLSPEYRDAANLQTLA